MSLKELLWILKFGEIGRALQIQEHGGRPMKIAQGPGEGGFSHLACAEQADYGKTAHGLVKRKSDETRNHY